IPRPAVRNTWWLAPLGGSRNCGTSSVFPFAATAHRRQILEELGLERVAELPPLQGCRSRRHDAGPLLGRERLGALQQLLEASERRPLTRPVSLVGPDEIPDPRGPFEPSAQHCVHKTSLRLPSARCRASCRRIGLLPTPSPLAIIGPRRLALGRGAMLSSVEDGSADGNAPCVERRGRILGWSARTLESGRLTIASQGLVC